MDLGKQVGPLPVGAWVGVVGGGLLIGWYFSKGSAKNVAATPAVPLTDPGVGTGGGQFVYDPPTAVTNPNTDKITDNATWSRQAINWLIAQGYDPGMAQTAVSKFINGTNRTLQEQTLINLALIHFGSPPESVPIPEVPQTPPVVSVPPGPKPKPVPKAFAHYTVKMGDTIGKIATEQHTSWWNIYVANDKVGLRPDGSRGVMNGPWDTRPGMVLLIPNTAAGRTGPPPQKGGPIRYYTVQNGDTVTSIATKFHLHPANVFQANDVAGPRPDGSRGFLVNPSQHLKPGLRLVIPYQ